MSLFRRLLPEMQNIIKSMEKELTGPWSNSSHSPSSFFFNRRPTNIANGSFFHEPAADIHEFNDKYVIEADLPGLNKDEITMELVNDRTIAIKGKFQRESGRNNNTNHNDNQKSTEQQSGHHHFERMEGEFMRQFELPEGIKTDEIKASLKDGVLRVEIPKMETGKRAESKKIPISD